MNLHLTQTVLAPSMVKQHGKRCVRTLVLASITAITLGSCAIASAAIVSGLHNTGVDNSGNPLPNGTLGDPHYQLIIVPAGSTTDIRTMTTADPLFPSGWLGDDTASTWIGPTNFFDGLPGSNVYRTTFTLSGPGTATISGRWANDDHGVGILVDGNYMGNTTADGDWGVWTPFSVTASGSGLHTLDFFVVNNPSSPSPTGLRVEFNGIPEPATSSLLALGVTALLARRCRHRRT